MTRGIEKNQCKVPLVNIINLQDSLLILYYGGIILIIGHQFYTLAS